MQNADYSMSIRLELLSEPYLEWARQLHNDPEVLSMLTDPHIVTPEEQISWFNKMSISASSRRVLVLTEDSIPAGLIRLDQIDWYNKSICVGLDISKDFRGKGLAKKVYHSVFEEWFVCQDFNRVWLMVAAYNTRARGLYTFLGFKEEGVQREALLKEGKYYDYIIMSILRREYDPSI